MKSGYFDGKYLIHVIGVGYVGLPLVLLFSSKFKVVAYDKVKSRIDQLRNQYDKNNEFSEKEIGERKNNIVFLDKLTKPTVSAIYIVTVPTPIDVAKNPDLDPLIQATSRVGSILSKGDIVIFESTVYPGCTNEVCIPILEKESSLRLNHDFFVGYSPERINPGDKSRTVELIDKIVSSSDSESLEIVYRLYNSVIRAPVHKVSKIEVAEAAKVIENIQRDVNIALMNEFSLIFNKLGLSTKEILDAASTKWNFLKFKPGLVGGHCIGVDPYYLIKKAKEFNYPAELMLTARRINESMVKFVVQEIAQKVIVLGLESTDIQILILGYTFKENISDTRNSKIIEIVDLLMKFGFQIIIYDPHVHQQGEVNDVKKSHRTLFISNLQKKKYHCVVIGVNHSVFQDTYPRIKEDFLVTGGVIIDLHNVGLLSGVSLTL